MLNKTIRALGLCALYVMLAISCSKGKTADMQNPAVKKDADIVLREAGGDFGYPNPFRHQNRGPGFFKMELIYHVLSFHPVKLFEKTKLVNTSSALPGNMVFIL